MDVHPPHGGIHSWRDFLIHLATITIGLLIALGLEAIVEYFHHQHLVQEARADIREEMKANEDRLTSNLAAVKEDEDRVQNDIKLLLLLRTGKKVGPGSLDYTFHWSSFGDSAWKTAQTSNAVSYMDFKRAQDLADVYSLQAELSDRVVNTQWEHGLAAAPFFISGSPDSMTAAEIQLGLQRSADLLMNLHFIEQILTQLGAQYKAELAKL